MMERYDKTESFDRELLRQVEKGIERAHAARRLSELQSASLKANSIGEISKEEERIYYIRLMTVRENLTSSFIRLSEIAGSMDPDVEGIDAVVSMMAYVLSALRSVRAECRRLYMRKYRKNDPDFETLYKGHYLIYVYGGDDDLIVYIGECTRNFARFYDMEDSRASKLLSRAFKRWKSGKEYETILSGQKCKIGFTCGLED